MGTLLLFRWQTWLPGRGLGWAASPHSKRVFSTDRIDLRGMKAIND
jgi:hypothetical protein